MTTIEVIQCSGFFAPIFKPQNSPLCSSETLQIKPNVKLIARQKGWGVGGNRAAPFERVGGEWGLRSNPCEISAEQFKTLPVPKHPPPSPLQVAPEALPHSHLDGSPPGAGIRAARLGAVLTCPLYLYLLRIWSQDKVSPKLGISWLKQQIGKPLQIS